MRSDLSSILDSQRLRDYLPQWRDSYLSAEEFPHIAIDDFLTQSVINKAIAEFPPIRDEGWIHYIHYNEKKGGLNRRELIPTPLREIIDALNSPEFVAWLSQMTGIDKLIADVALEGGGLHQIERGGFLNIHADFTTHPHHRLWRRRVNVLLYLNPNWQDEYGGHLELWTRDMKHCFKKILPLANRCVIFNTDKDSFHGHPNPLTCPEGTTRRSIALYYFTEEAAPPLKIATNYQARPEDGSKAVLIFLDKKILSAYNRLKGWLGISDDTVSNLLRIIAKIKKK